MFLESYVSPNGDESDVSRTEGHTVYKTKFEQNFRKDNFSSLCVCYKVCDKLLCIDLCNETFSGL